MARTMYRRLVRLQSYVEPVLADKVDRFCAAKGLSESKLIKSSVSTYIEGTSDSALLLRRLDGIEGAIARHHRDDEFHAEAFAVFVRLWLAYMPTIPEDRKAAARMNSESQFKKFAERVAQHFDRGERFLDMQPADSRESGTRDEVDVSAEGPTGGPEHT
jgi:hypothetical protein